MINFLNLPSGKTFKNYTNSKEVFFLIIIKKLLIDIKMFFLIIIKNFFFRTIKDVFFNNYKEFFITIKNKIFFNFL